eukprot:m.153535 g.153535  ORF g.153535 m.153535 type:complete len:144 (-) comp15121_c0_seq3:27-458(-)
MLSSSLCHRGQITQLKTVIEGLRRDIALAQLAGAGEEPLLAREEMMRLNLETEKEKYRAGLAQLKGLKQEVDHIQHLLQLAKVKLHHDFNAWFEGMAGLESASASGPPSRAGSSSSRDLRTGDRATDDDIAAFYRTKQALERR